MVLVGSQGAPEAVANSSLFELDPVTGALTAAGSVWLGASSATWMAWRRDQTVLYVGGQCTTTDAAAGLCARSAAADDATADGLVTALRLNVPARSLSLISSCALRDAQGVPAGGNIPVAIGLHPLESSVASASYASGVIQVCPIFPETRGVSPAPATSSFLGTHAHDVVWSPAPPGGGLPWMYVPTLGDDTVRYARAEPGGALSLRRDALFLPGGRPIEIGWNGALTWNNRTLARGPRKMQFHPSLPFAYLLNELNNTVVRLRYDAATGVLWDPLEISTLRPGYPRPGQNAGGLAQQAAAVLVHPGGQFLYATNRGNPGPNPPRGSATDDSDNSIAIIALAADGGMALVRHETAGGAIHYPRHIALSPDARFLLCGNQRGDTISVFAVEGGGRDLRLLSSTQLDAQASPAFIAIFADTPPATGGGAAASGGGDPGGAAQGRLAAEVLGAVLGLAAAGVVLAYARRLVVCADDEGEGGAGGDAEEGGRVVRNSVAEAAEWNKPSGAAGRH